MDTSKNTSKRYFDRLFEGIRIEPINSAYFKSAEIMGRFATLSQYPLLILIYQKLPLLPVVLSSGVFQAASHSRASVLSIILRASASLSRTAAF